MVSDNIPTSRHHGAPKHGDALLAGLLRCRRCGRKLTLRYTGTRHDIPRYSCWRGWLDNGEPRCIAFGGLRVDDAIEAELLQGARAGRGRRGGGGRSASWPSTATRCARRCCATCRPPATPRTGHSGSTTPSIPPTGWWRQSWKRAGTGRSSRWPRSRPGSPATTRRHCRPGDARRPPWRTLADDLQSVWRAPATDARLKKRIVRTVVQEVDRRPRRSRRRDRAAHPLDGRGPHRVAVAAPPAWSAQQHLARHHRRRPPARPHRQRRRHRRHAEPQWAEDRPWKPLDPRARDGPTLPPRHPGPSARARGRGALAQSQQGRSPPADQPEDAAPRRGGRLDRGRCIRSRMGPGSSVAPS